MDLKSRGDLSAGNEESNRCYKRACEGRWRESPVGFQALIMAFSWSPNANPPSGDLRYPPFGFFFFLRFYLFFWREGKGGRKNERNIDVRQKLQSVASPMRPNRDQTHHPGMCPTREPRNQTSDLLPLRNNTQPTEPPWSGRDSHTFCLGKLPAEKWILGKYNTFAQFTLFNSP